MVRILRKRGEVVSIGEDYLDFEVELVTQGSLIVETIDIDNKTYEFSNCEYKENVTRLTVKLLVSEGNIPFVLAAIESGFINLEELVSIKHKEYTSDIIQNESEFNCVGFSCCSRTVGRKIVYDVCYTEASISEYEVRKGIQKYFEDLYVDHTVYMNNLHTPASIYFNQSKYHMIGNCTGTRLHTYGFPAIRLDLEEQDYYLEQPNYYKNFNIVGYKLSNEELSPESLIRASYEDIIKIVKGDISLLNKK